MVCVLAHRERRTSNTWNQSNLGRRAHVGGTEDAGRLQLRMLAAVEWTK